MNNIMEQNSINTSIRKARKKFVLRIFAFTLLFTIIITLIIPSFFTMFISYKTKDYTRMLSNITQVQAPISNVGFTSNNDFYSHEVGVITTTYRGWSISENMVKSQEILKAKIDVPSLKMNINENNGAVFNLKPTENTNTEFTKLILQKNSNNVGIVNYTLKDAVNINQIQEIVSNYEVKVLWLAVFTGLEYEHLDTVNMGKDVQYRQFGFPTSTFINGEFRELDYNNPSQYIEFLKNEWKWCIDNNGLVKSSKDMLVFKDMKKALASDVSIYGFTIVGTTSELQKLCNDKKIVSGNVYGIYPWDWTE